MSSPQQQPENRILSRSWFYEFPLPDGTLTQSYLPESVRAVHTGREKMLFEFLDPIFGGMWRDLTAIDLGCHEGYFAFRLAQKGCRSVIGVDAQPEHLEHAEWIRQTHSLDNLSFVHGDVQNQELFKAGPFDIVLLFGILYHVPNIVGALRQARAATRTVCLIETQISPELYGDLDWGASHWKKEIRGCIALVEEAGDVDERNREAGLSGVSMVPSLRALFFLLGLVGFERVELLHAGPDSYEQHRRGKRVIVAAFS